MTQSAAAEAPPPRDRARRVRGLPAFLAGTLAATLRAIRVVRPLAWMLLASLVLVGIPGIVLRWGDFVVAVVLLAVVFLLSLVFLFGRIGYDVTLTLTRTRVVVGERAFGSLSLHNPTARTLPATRVMLPVGTGRGSFDVPRLAGNATREELFSVPTHARGVLVVGPVSVLRGDPIGLFERVDVRSDRAELYVHPRTVALADLSLGHMRDLEGLPVGDLADDDVSFHALREYQQGDDLRRVHWRSTAHTGTVMVRQYEQSRRSTYLLGLSTSSGDYADPDQFELAVSIAGSVGVRALTEGLALSALVPGRDPRTATARGFLDVLSGVSLSRARGGDVISIGAALAAQHQDSALAIFVCGSEVTPLALENAFARLQSRTRVLGIVAEQGAPASLRPVGEASVLTIGALDDLPRALRRALQ